MKIKEYPLRQTKHAKTKIAIMNSFIKHLEKTPFEDISIREICKSVEVSEGTFFNYFSEKIDIINYYSSLLFIKIFWKTQNQTPKRTYLTLIEAIFKNVAAELNNINIIYQIISIMIMQREKPRVVVISDIEKSLFFPDYQGIEGTPVISINDYFNNCLEKAIQNGELPKKTNINDVLVSLSTILAGTLLAVKFTDIKNQEYHYVRQLKLLWQGLGLEIKK